MFKNVVLVVGTIVKQNNNSDKKKKNYGAWFLVGQSTSIIPAKVTVAVASHYIMYTVKHSHHYLSSELQLVEVVGGFSEALNVVSACKPL